MIVLGVSPGLAALAYSVLSFRGPDLSADPIDTDVLHGTGHSETAPFWRVSKSARVHKLVMGVVLERDPPGVLALGPAVDPEEPRKHVEAVRTMLTEFAMMLGAHVVTFNDEAEVREELTAAFEGKVRVGQRGLRSAVRDLLVSPLPSSNRRVMLATAVALAGAHRVRCEKFK